MSKGWHLGLNNIQQLKEVQIVQTTGRLDSYSAAINKTIKTGPSKAVVSTKNCLAGKDEIKNANKKCNSCGTNSYDLNNTVVQESKSEPNHELGRHPEKIEYCILNYKHAICHQCDTPAFNLYWLQHCLWCMHDGEHFIL